MSFAQDGLEFCPGYIQRGRLEEIMRKMLMIMEPFCDHPTDRSNSLYRCFAEIGKCNYKLRSNLYMLFGRLVDLPLLLTEPKIAKRIREFGLSVYTIQAYSIFCIEPNDDRHLFLPHQDLVDRTSLKGLQFWIPLSNGKDIDGLSVWRCSHLRGPMKHKWIAGADEA